MDAILTTSIESQWILCLIQVTILMSISWVVGRVALRRFPDISASVGIVALLVSASLIALTWAEVPRPFQLTVQTDVQTAALTDSATNHSSAWRLESTKDTVQSPPSWLGKFTTTFYWAAPTGLNPGDASKSYAISPVSATNVLLLLTLLGGLVGVFRVVHSSIAIDGLVRSSSPVEDAKIRAEVQRIVSLLPIEREHQEFRVRQFNGPGSPFVSWLTGKTIFVPESFLTWSDSEQSVSLAHEIGHLQRRDHYCRLITQLTFCLTWLHPFAWILHRQTLLAQELAADQVAAQATQNSSAYCRGLSRLALRFDAECRHPSALGVSVSSSLIRRITMLKGITHRLPCSRFINRCVTWSAVIACTWIGCWSVSGQTTTQEKQADSKVVAASHTTPVKMFSKPATAPWEVIGNQSGYYEVEVGRVLNHPSCSLYRPMITKALNWALRSDSDELPTIKQFGLALDEITQIRGALVVSYNYDSNAPDGHRSSLGLGAVAKTEVTTADPVDWPGLINALDFEKLHTYIFARFPAYAGTDLEVVRDAWSRSAEKSCTNVFDMASLEKQKDGKQESVSETRKAVWQAVSGGAVTVVYDIDQNVELPEDYREKDLLNQAHCEMITATETAAWGVDLSLIHI